MKQQLKTPRGRGFGFFETDVADIRRFMKDLGWTETRLAKESGLSQQQINRFLNGKRKLSAAASDRVYEAIRRGQNPSLSPEAAARIRAKVAASSGPESTGKKDDPTPENIFDAYQKWGIVEAEALSAPPREPEAYEAWKAKRIQQFEAVKKLEFMTEQSRRWEETSSFLAKEADKWKATATAQSETISALKETLCLYKARIDRLKQQLETAGITPTD